jgi:hypothetical protein
MKTNYSRRNFLGYAGQAISLTTGAALLIRSSQALSAPQAATVSPRGLGGASTDLETWLLTTGRGKVAATEIEPLAQIWLGRRQTSHVRGTRQ